MTDKNTYKRAQLHTYLLTGTITLLTEACAAVETPDAFMLYTRSMLVTLAAMSKDGTIGTAKATLRLLLDEAPGDNASYPELGTVREAMKAMIPGLE